MQDTSKILVDLDSLLDVRGSILLRLMDQEKLSVYLNTDEYNFREIDLFPIDNKEEYNRLNKERPADLIPNSIVTNILTCLKSKLANMEKRNNFKNENKTPEVVLNVYPFKLTDGQIKSLQNLLFVKLETNTLVNVVSLSNKELTPYFIKANGFTACFLYNFKEWIGEHTEYLDKNKMPEIFMYFPALYHEMKDVKDLDVIKKLGFKDLFAYTEYLFSSVINLNFLPVVFYSNLVTASLYLDKFNDVLKDEKLSEDNTEEKPNGDSSTKIQVSR